MLAVDGFDMGALTQRQQEALDGWLKDGGVAIVGGGAKAAENFGFFEKYTGISAGTVESGGEFARVTNLNGIFAGRDTP